MLAARLLLQLVLAASLLLVVCRAQPRMPPVNVPGGLSSANPFPPPAATTTDASSSPASSSSSPPGAPASASSSSDVCTAAPTLSCEEQKLVVWHAKENLSDRISQLSDSVTLSHLSAYTTAVGDLSFAEATAREVCETSAPLVCNGTAASSLHASMDSSAVALLSQLNSAAHPALSDSAVRPLIGALATTAAAYLDEATQQELACYRDQSTAVSCSQRRADLAADSDQLDRNEQTLVSQFDIFNPGQSTISVESFDAALESLAKVHADAIQIDEECRCQSSAAAGNSSGSITSTGDVEVVDPESSASSNTTTTAASPSDVSPSDCTAAPMMSCTEAGAAISTLTLRLGDRISALSDDVSLDRLASYLFAVQGLAHSKAIAREACGETVECSSSLDPAESRSAVDASMVRLIALVESQPHPSITDDGVRAQIMVAATDGAQYLDQAVLQKLACDAPESCTASRSDFLAAKSQFSRDGFKILSGYNSTSPGDSEISEADYDSVLGSLTDVLADSILIDSSCRCASTSETTTPTTIDDTPASSDPSSDPTVVLEPSIVIPPAEDSSAATASTVHAHDDIRPVVACSHPFSNCDLHLHPLPIVSAPESASPSSADATHTLVSISASVNSASGKTIGMVAVVLLAAPTFLLRAL